MARKQSFLQNYRTDFSSNSSTFCR